jgi:hypothetical protein
LGGNLRYCRATCCCSALQEQPSRARALSPQPWRLMSRFTGRAPTISERQRLISGHDKGRQRPIVCKVVGATSGCSRFQQTHLADRLYARIPAWLRLEGSHSPYKGVEVIPATKLDSIRAAWSVGDRLGALRIAARFFDRSGTTKAFKRGMDAHNNPEFYRQLGKGSGFVAQNCAGIASAQIQFVTFPPRQWPGICLISIHEHRSTVPRTSFASRVCACR